MPPTPRIPRYARNDNLLLLVTFLPRLITPPILPEPVRTMPAAGLAAVPALPEIPLREDHERSLEVEVLAFDQVARHGFQLFFDPCSIAAAFCS